MRWVSYLILIALIAFNSSCDKRSPNSNIDPTVAEKLKPVASFENSADSATVGQTITFTNTSKKDPTQFYWTFNGGNPFNSTTPVTTVRYDTIGLYAVSLKVKNNFGLDSLLKNNLISISYKSNFSNDLQFWNIEKNWDYSTSNNIPGNSGMVAYSVALNAITMTSDYASMSRTFPYIPSNANLEFWYYIYSPKGILNIKENGKTISSIAGFGRGTTKVPLTGGKNTTITFESILYPTSSIYISNIIISPK